MGDVDNSSATEEASVSSAGNKTLCPQVVPLKKKRNLPGMPGTSALKSTLASYRRYF